MAYTAAQIEQAVAVLVRKIPGLTREAATVWVRSEQGVNNNVLGVTYTDGAGRQRLFSYATIAAGAAAAADHFNNSRWYVTARRIVAGTTDPTTQLRAIAASPWNGGHYRRSTVFAPYLQGQPRTVKSAVKAPAPRRATSTAGGGGGVAAATADQWNAVIACLPPGTRRLSALNVGKLRACAAAQGVNLSGVDLASFYGRSISDLRDALAAQGTIPGASLLPDLFAWVPGFAVSVALLIAVLVLGYRGVRAILG